jgi:hypothetical protein
MNEETVLYAVFYSYTDPIDRYEDGDTLLAVTSTLDKDIALVEQDWKLYNDTSMKWEQADNTPYTEYATLCRKTVNG